MRLELEETPRQLLAGAAASAVFLAAYFPLQLALWIAGPLALVAFGAVLVAIARRPPAQERLVVSDVSEAELAAAREVLSEGAARLRMAAAALPEADAERFLRMAGLVERIEAHHAADPQDVRHTRRFLRHDFPRLIETAEAFAALTVRAGDDPAAAARLAEVGARITAMIPALERIDQACLENDFVRLEIETEVLSEQLGRR